MRNKITKIEDMIGKTLGFLTVIGNAAPHLTNANYLSRRWLFKCICGKELIINPANVLNGSTKSCGCKRGEITKRCIKEYYAKKYKNPVEGRLLENYKNYKNNKKCKEFLLTKEHFIELVNSNCYYCGLPPFLVRGNKTKSVTKPLNGIDRLDSSIGYIIGNVVPCCIHCNKAKMSRSEDEFKEWIKLVYNNLYSQEKGRN